MTVWSLPWTRCWATGNSSVAAIDMLEKAGRRPNIRFLCLLPPPKVGRA